MLRWKCWLMLSLILAVVLAGCVSREEAPAIVRVGAGHEPSTLDPSLLNDTFCCAIISELAPSLTALDADTSEVIPRLAVEWDVSQDGLVWTFRLREDVHWVRYDPEQGEPEKMRQVTAHDVVYGTQRTLDPGTGAMFAFALYPIKNAQAVNTGAVESLDAIGVIALDEHTVQFTLMEPTAYFPSLVAASWTNPQPREAIAESGELWTEPGHIWTYGPYLLDTWDHDSRLVLRRNPHYWDAANVALEKVELVLAGTEFTQLAQFEAGELDTAHFPITEQERLQADAALSQQLQLEPNKCTFYLGFNTAYPPLDDKRVRKALSAAIDRDLLSREVLQGAGTLAKSFGSPGVFGSPAEDASFEGPTFDLDQARQWLAEAGYPGGQGFPELNYLLSSTSTCQYTSEFIQQQWRQNLGIEVKLIQQESKVFMQTLRTDPPPLWEARWCAAAPDSHFTLSWYLHPVKGMNDGEWDASDPAAQRFAELVDGAVTEMDREQRRAMYYEAEQIICADEAIVAPLAYLTTRWITKPYLERSHREMWWDMYKWQVKPH